MESGTEDRLELWRTAGSKYDAAPLAVHSALSVCVSGMLICSDGCMWSGVKIKKGTSH